MAGGSFSSHGKFLRAPEREVSLVTGRDFPRKKRLQHLRDIILEAVQGRVITDKKGLNILEMND